MKRFFFCIFVLLKQKWRLPLMEREEVSGKMAIIAQTCNVYCEMKELLFTLSPELSSKAINK
jgi:hypothetical protein